MRTTRTWWAAFLMLGACAPDPTDASQTKSADAASTVAPPASAPPVSAAPVSAAPSTAASAAASSAAPVAEHVDTPEEEKFWSDLAAMFNTEKRCKGGGWSGDANITIANGKIVKFDILYYDSKKGKAVPSAVPELKGKAAPPMPASLKTIFEKPVSVLVCFGGKIYQGPAKE